MIRAAVLAPSAEIVVGFFKSIGCIRKQEEFREQGLPCLKVYPDPFFEKNIND